MTASRLAGQRIAFTGKFKNLRKDEAKPIVIAEKAKVDDKLGKDTTVLVFAAPSGVDYAKAEKMKKAGAPIELVSEDEFRKSWLLPTADQAFAMLTDGKTGKSRLANLLELNRPPYMRSPDEFSTVDLVERSLAGAKLSKVSLCGVHFTSCDLQGADLTDAKWLDHANKSDFRKASAKGLELVAPSECDFRGADLTKARLSDVTNCKFDDATLDGMHAGYAKISKCSFANASLKKADLDNAKFRDCDFTNADFTGAELKETKFENCELTGAKGLPSAEDKKPLAKGPAHQALAKAAPTFKNVTVTAFLKIGTKKVECTLYQFDHGGNPSRHQAWLAGKDVGNLSLADAIGTIARQNKAAKLDEKSLVVKATKGKSAPALKPKAFEAAVLEAWREVLA